MNPRRRRMLIPGLLVLLLLIVAIASLLGRADAVPAVALACDGTLLGASPLGSGTLSGFIF